MRSKFSQDFKDSIYNNNDLNLEYFEKWLANRLTDMFNPITAIIETRESIKQRISDKNKDRKYNRQQHSIFQMSGNNSNTNKQLFNLKCSTIAKFHFAQKLKIYPILIKLKLLKIKTLFQLFIKYSLNKQMQIKNFMQNRWLQEASSCHNAPSKSSGNLPSRHQHHHRHRSTQSERHRSI